MWIVEHYELWGLFLVCFLAATILPFSSEIAVLYCLHDTHNALWLVITLASLGNILGGMTNYFIGAWGNSLWKKRLGLGQKFQNVQEKLVRFGPPAAFFSWIPLIGDPLLVALGFYKSPWKSTFFWMSVGKTGRYVLLLSFI